MSMGRFAGYFFALIACATAAFSSVPNSSTSVPPLDSVSAPVRVALAR